jgi:hypothetical protein
MRQVRGVLRQAQVARLRDHRSEDS